MVFPAFAFYDVTLQEDGGVTGIATVKMTGVLSQSTISLKWTYEVGGQTETSEAVSGTIYTAAPLAFTFSESVHGSEGGIGDYENATTLYDIVGLKKDGDSRKGVWIYGDDTESPFPDYREILKAENMEKYDMFRLSSAAGSFFYDLHNLSDSHLPVESKRQPRALRRQSLYQCIRRRLLCKGRRMGP